MMMCQLMVRLGGAVLATSALVLSVACSPTAAPSTQSVSANAGYDVTRDPAVSGQYVASGAYVDGRGVNQDEVKARALLLGVEAARKDGYDLVLWSDPGAATSTLTTVYRSNSGMRPGTFQTYGHYLSVTYVLRGYKSTGAHPPTARPVAAVVEQLNGELARRKP